MGCPVNQIVVDSGELADQLRYVHSGIDERVVGTARLTACEPGCGHLREGVGSGLTTCRLHVDHDEGDAMQELSRMLGRPGACVQEHHWGDRKSGVLHRK